MMIRKKSKREILSNILNMKTVLVGLMVAIFMIFATMEGTEISSILVGAGFFALASAMLLKAGEISKKFYR